MQTNKKETVSVLRWVKASERMPEVVEFRIMVPCKWSDKDGEVFMVCAYEDGLAIPKQQWHLLLWLEEIESPSEETQEEKSCGSFGEFALMASKAWKKAAANMEKIGEVVTNEQKTFWQAGYISALQSQPQPLKEDALPVSTEEDKITTDEELEREAAELYQYPEHNLYRPDSNEEEIWTIDRERAAHINARKMSIRLKEREIAEKACAYAIENCIINLNTKDGIAAEIEFDSTEYLDTNYPIIK